MSAPPATPPRPLRLCYFGTYRAHYARNRIMVQGLRQAGAEVLECREALWSGTEERIRAARGGWASPPFAWRVVRTYARLVKRHRAIGQYDVLVVGYPGPFDVFVARLLSWWRRRPLVWDVLMSIHQVALERGLPATGRWTIRALGLVERLACRLPDRLVIDTRAHAAWFQRRYDLSPNAFCLVPIGADEGVFRPLRTDPAPGARPECFRVIYHGSFIPNHGIRYIIEAARLLADRRDIHFQLIGNGPERPLAMDLAGREALTRVEFTGWLEGQEFVRTASRADLCLGAFGQTPLSLMTVHNKVYEGMAMRLPVVTGDSPAVRDAFRDREHVYLVDRREPADLARAIERLRADDGLRERLAEGGHRLFLERYTLGAIGRQALPHFDALRRRA